LQEQVFQQCDIIVVLTHVIDNAVYRFMSHTCTLQAGARSKPASSTPLIISKAAEQQQAGKAIPDMFKLEPSEEQRRYGIVKKQLVDALAPTPDTIAAVGSNPVLASGALPLACCQHLFRHNSMQ
jgi:hypothetical protein